MSTSPQPDAETRPAAPVGAGIRRAALRELDAPTLHAIARLRVDVFVVEQACPYPELDARDAEPGTEHVWHTGDGVPRDGDLVPVAAALRVLVEPAGARRIGRVVTAPHARGRGLAGVLLQDVVRRHGGADLVLDAQAHLAGWYGRHGFTVEGPEFLEDGIPHVPMRRPGTSA